MSPVSGFFLELLELLEALETRDSLELFVGGGITSTGSRTVAPVSRSSDMIEASSQSRKILRSGGVSTNFAHVIRRGFGGLRRLRVVVT